jgi:hypothetical protein
MSDFLERLSRWRGRSFVQRELESRGFLIPTRYQEFISAACSPDARHGLDLYWDEVAREYVCSGGQVNSIARSFPDTRCYRSEYLDELASVRKPSSLFELAPLHLCLNEVAIKRRSDLGFDPQMIRTVDTEKQPEIQRHGLRSEQWTGEKKDVGRIFAELMQAKDFKKRKASFLKASPSGLVFGGVADLGGRPYCITVPFNFFVAADLDIIESFGLSFEPIAPGFWFYSRFDSRESGLLGFRAYVEMIDIMSESFSSVAETR